MNECMKSQKWLCMADELSGEIGPDNAKYDIKLAQASLDIRILARLHAAHCESCSERWDDADICPLPVIEVEQL